MSISSILRRTALGVGLLTVAALPAPAGAATPEQVTTAIDSATQWLRAQQKPSGQFEDFGGDMTATAFAAAGISAADVRATSGDPSLQDYLLGEYSDEEWTGPVTKPVTDYEQAILATYAAGLDPARLSAESNLPGQIAARWNPGTGSFGPPSTNGTAFAILALTRTALPGWALKPAVSYLRRNQHDDGGWGFSAATTKTAQEFESEADMTGAAIAAFCESGVPVYDPQVAAGVAFMREAMIDETGGVEYFGPPGNADTNSWVVSGLTACGIDPQGAEWTTPVFAKTPVDFIISQQLTDPGEEGAFPGYLGTADTYTTQDALRALAGEVFTAVPPARSEPAQPSLRPLPAVAAGTAVPHVLAIERDPGNVRLCKVVAAAGASLTEVLSAAKASAVPFGCVTSFTTSGGLIASINGVAPANEDEAWLLRLDRSPEVVAGEQLVDFGAMVSLRRGEKPHGSDQVSGPAGPTGKAGEQGSRGKRGAKGRPGRNAHITCRAHRGKRAGKARIRCSVKNGKAQRGR